MQTLSPNDRPHDIRDPISVQGGPVINVLADEATRLPTVFMSLLCVRYVFPGRSKIHDVVLERTRDLTLL
jgi:hypothetical protein